ncbi:MAG: LamG domain-containing protein [Chitinispirillaceae bacterium]|nr:LamG domain-containing protein [Chitinispirillaceae bacterium]
MRIFGGKFFTLITSAPLLIIAGCCGNNPVDQLLDFLKNEVITVIDEEPNDTTTGDECTGANDFSGCWIISQSNGEAGTIALSQLDCSISGTVSLDGKENGTISGKANGSLIDFTVTYIDGKKVAYSAMLNDDASSITSGKGISSDGKTFTWSASKGECQSVSVDGCWAVDQNNGHIGIITLQQNGSTITGTSGWTTHSNGPIKGSIEGTTLTFTITYPEGVTGYYSATISNDQLSLINGATKSSTGDQAQWNAKKTTCNIPNIKGCWAVDQDNGHVGILTLQQNGSSVTGTSRWTTHSNGPIKGSIEGTTLSFTISYPEGVIGYYTTTINSNATALVNGTTTSSTGDSAYWSAEKTTCPQQADCELKMDQYTLALYHLNEKNGTTLTDETGRWNGTLYGGVRVPGLCGNGLQFNSGEYATFDTIIPDAQPEGTVELSVMFDKDFDTAGAYSIFGNDGSRIQVIYKNGQLFFLKNHSNIHKYTNAGFTVVPGKWVTIAVTWGAKGMRIFIDKELVSANTDCTAYEVSPRTTLENIFYIGKKTWCCMDGIGISKALSFKGAIDEIRVSSIARY